MYAASMLPRLDPSNVYVHCYLNGLSYLTSRILAAGRSNHGKAYVRAPRGSAGLGARRFARLRSDNNFDVAKG